jgi:hypothetical protein
MENSVAINKDVNIVAYYFHNRGRALKCYPKRMEYSGRTIEFTETGLRHPTKQGSRMIHVFDMTDGQADYRLEFDAQELNWTLVAISDTQYAPATNLHPATA